MILFIHMKNIILVGAGAVVIVGGIYLATRDRTVQNDEIGLPPEVQEQQIEMAGEARPDEDVYDVETTFEHVAPGEYSEIYVRFKSTPNIPVSVVLNGIDGKQQEIIGVTSDENGEGHVTFRITQFGNYMTGVKTAKFTSWTPITVK